MQITSQTIKNLIVTVNILICTSALADPVINQSRLDRYREEYKDAVTPIKYILTHEDESPCCSDTSGKKVYILNIRQNAPGKLAYSSEINKLFKEHFEVEIDSESLISTPNADYIVLTMSRPAEYSDRKVRCAAGMGESRAFLVSVSGNKVDIINRDLSDCNHKYRVLRTPTATGYKVSSINGAGKPVSFLLHGTSFIRSNDPVSKEEK